jgi:hypothetical protein
METRDEYFGEDNELRFEYSVVSGCPKSDSGFHCSCFDQGTECHLCDALPKAAHE